MSATNCGSPVPASTPGELIQFVKGIPKIELHAHLSGSLRDSTILELMEAHYSPEEIATQAKICRLSPDDSSDTRTMAECFALFKVLHRIISSPEILYRITLEVLEDFVLIDNTMYIELRTTPRGIPSCPVPDNGTCTLPTSSSPCQYFSKRNYIETVCAAIREFSQIIEALNATAFNALNTPEKHIPVSAPECFTESPYFPYSRSIFIRHEAAARAGRVIRFCGVGLIVSVDRSQSVQEAKETVSLAVELQRSPSLLPIVGVDFSGNPHLASFSAFRSVFDDAREAGLACTVHFAETTNEEDSLAIMDFAPERVGHAALMSDAVFSILVEKGMRKSSDENIPPTPTSPSTSPCPGIGVEICISSNLACKLHEAVGGHPFADILRAGIITSLCTDDKGVFGVNITTEWLHTLSFPEFNHTLPPTALPKGSEDTTTLPQSICLPVSLEQSKAALAKFAKNAVEMCFCPPDVKHAMRAEIDDFVENN